ncbi:hypothetical protein NDU88_000345 [Pleurodeles waltl]|uniref:Uncharacterized protein n=1 Tax=Pleurodeles waltl TaxID=8319 RepID=A0AAV7UPQ1_PLEWA|nr:hypothetical protein NDU88_000345 [Pleurodeles waltl]
MWGWWTLQGAAGLVAALFAQCWRVPGRTCCEGLRQLDRAWRPPGGELWEPAMDSAGLAELVCGDLYHCWVRPTCLWDGRLGLVRIRAWRRGGVGPGLRGPCWLREGYICGGIAG